MQLIGLVLFLAWLISMSFVVTGARQRNRSGLGWGILAFFFSPLLAGFGLLMIGEK